jgi:DNA-binding NtrC family response regulator
MALQHYPFPGNVRELRNVLERAALMADGDSIELSQLAERTELYRPQIEVYKKAAQRIFGVESKRVVGKLLFTRVGEVTEL